MIYGTAPLKSDDATRLAPIAAVRPGWGEMGILLAASILTLIGVSLGPDVPQWINMVAPIMLSVAMALGALALIRHEARAVWAPLFWVRIVMIAFSGIGSLVPFFANDVTRGALDRFFTVFPADMTKYNAVICVFTLVMLFAARVCCALVDMNVRRREGPVLKVKPSALDAGQFGLLALALSLPIKIPSSWIPFVTGVPFSLPNSIALFGMLSYIAYPLLIYHALSTGKRWPFFAAIPFILIESTLGLLMFNKTELLFPLIFSFLGVLFQRATLMRMLVGGVALFLVYSVATPFAAYGRSQEARDTGSIDTTLSRSIVIASRYDWRVGNQDEGEFQGGWARLTYITAGSFAISQYDQGVPGTTMENVFLILVPRVVYPDKPNMSLIFAEFNYAVTGNDKSQSAPGIPPEGYWNYGWAGVVGFAVLMGVVYALWSIYAIATLQAGAWHLLFISLIGVRVASRIDGLIVTDFVPMIPFAIFAHFLLTFGNELMLRGKAARARPLQLTHGGA